MYDNQQQEPNAANTPNPRQKAMALKESLDPNHVVHTMLSEHEKILEFLDELRCLNQTIQQMDTYEGSLHEFERLRFLAESLVGAEPHHQREEQVLFPEFEKRGPSGPPHAMRIEHDELRKHKKKLKQLAENVDNMDFATFKKELNDAAEFIVPTLSEHIAKEDNVLYPFALKIIAEENTWEKMKEESDRIGYCSFTPRQ